MFVLVCVCMYVCVGMCVYPFIYVSTCVYVRGLPCVCLSEHVYSVFQCRDICCTCFAVVSTQLLPLPSLLPSLLPLSLPRLSIPLLYHTHFSSSTSISKHFSLQYCCPSNALASIGSLLIRKVYSSDDTNMPLLYLRKAVSLNSVEGEWELAQVRHHSLLIYYLLFDLTIVN